MGGVGVVLACVRPQLPSRLLLLTDPRTDHQAIAEGVPLTDRSRWDCRRLETEPVFFTNLD